MDSWEVMRPGRVRSPESLGARIAGLRAQRGWTQQELADRIGISRVAVSHLETDINVPGERTVALLAGCFRLEPHELVDGTSYPPAKTDRLPVVAARWTHVEHRLALLDRDLDWIDRLGTPTDGVDPAAILRAWRIEVEDLRRSCFDPGEQELLDAARDRLNGFG